jgi:UDP-3-O-[3-hydroxymyristoyl] N-acetylglucosamine deacetylase/3-hydroxyacyl-[acyl-carrier-protein] dehydratase
MVRLNLLKALEKAGIEEQNTKRNIYVVKEIISLLMRKVERILIMPNDSYCVTTMVDFGQRF